MLSSVFNVLCVFCINHNLVSLLLFTSTLMAFFRQSNSLRYNNVKNDDNEKPFFIEPMANITTRVGQIAKFQCLIGNLKDHKVAWIRKDLHIFLGRGDSVIVRDSRISTGNHSSKIFFLQIQNVRQDDEGEYMCEVNSLPAIKQSALLQVTVAPYFIEELTSSDIDVKEGDSISLRCNAQGFPPPKVEWRREDKEDIITSLLDLSSDMSSDPEIVTTKKVSGEYLNITKINRLQMGAHLCIASNGIPNSVSKRIFLGVNFDPMIWTPKQRIGVPLDNEAHLICTIDAYPRPEVYWLRAKDRQIIVDNNSNKYESNLNDVSVYKFEAHLFVRNLQLTDYSDYICVARNVMNEASGKLNIYQVPKPPTPPPRAPSRSKPQRNNNSNKKLSSKVSSGKIEKQSKANQINLASIISNPFNNKESHERLPSQPSQDDYQDRFSTDSDSTRETQFCQLKILLSISTIIVSLHLMNQFTF